MTRICGCWALDDGLLVALHSGINRRKVVKETDKELDSKVNVVCAAHFANGVHRQLRVANVYKKRKQKRS